MGVLGMEMFSFLSDRMFRVIDVNHDNEVWLSFANSYFHRLK